MPRPQKERIIKEPPQFTEFKPMGMPGRFIETISLSIDEYEALRLSDYLGMTQEESAEEMAISRPTFTRLIENARRKMAKMIVQGKRLIIEGGNIHFRQNLIRCLNCGHLFNIKIDASIKACPACGSDNLLNLAGGFGHGRCSHKNKRR